MPALPTLTVGLVGGTGITGSGSGVTVTAPDATTAVSGDVPWAHHARMLPSGSTTASGSKAPWPVGPLCNGVAASKSHVKPSLEVPA